MNKGYNIVCGIFVQNLTHTELSLSHATVNTGSLSKPPDSVPPGQRETVVITLFHVCNIDNYAYIHLVIIIMSAFNQIAVFLTVNHFSIYS